MADFFGGTIWLHCGDGRHRHLSILTCPGVKDVVCLTEIVETTESADVMLPGLEENCVLFEEIFDRIWKRVIKGDRIALVLIGND